MSKADDRLGEAIARQWRRTGQATRPTFASCWRAAQLRHANATRRYQRFALAATIVAAVIIGMNARTPTGDGIAYIEIAELLDTTSWTAPSDVLLPEHRFDIYREIPVLTEST